MMARVIKKPQAQEDLDRCAAYLTQQHSTRTGLRFLDAAERAFALLADMPEAGSIVEYDSPSMTGLRCWRIRKFERYVVYYRPMRNGIEVIRVLHGAQDAETHLL
jgi:toxin ParE1/3/4